MRKIIHLLVFCFLVPCAQAQNWPGQSNNQVGYAAYGVLNAAACGAFSSGTSWASRTVIRNCTYSTYQTVNCIFCEFDSVDFLGTGTTAGTLFSGAGPILCKGCRFQSNDVANYNVQSTSVVTCVYCSVVPLASLATSPPGTTWPSAGAGQNTTTQISGTNALIGSSAYQYGLNLTGGGPFICWSCDVWAFANAAVFYSTSTQMWLVNSWFHDARYAGTFTDHTDGPGYLNGAAGVSNALIVGNTIASIGNTQGIAIQGGTSGLSNILATGNFVSGFGYSVALNGVSVPITSFTGSSGTLTFQSANSLSPGNVIYLTGFTGGNVGLNQTVTVGTATGTQFTAAVTGSGYTSQAGAWGNSTGNVFAHNVFGTDLFPVNGPLYGAAAAWGTAPFACNAISYRSGTTWTDSQGWTPVLSNNAQYWIENANPASTTDQGGNTHCGSVSKNALLWLPAALSTQTIVLSSSNSGSLTIASIVASSQYSQTNNCPGTLVSGASCRIVVTYAPTGTGPVSGTLTITDNDPSSPEIVPLLGIDAPTAPPATTTIGAPPYFGIDVNSSSLYPSSIFHNCLRLWDTNGAEWAFVNTAANTFTWTTFDSILANAAAAGVNCVMMPLARTPNFASSNTNLTISPVTFSGTMTIGETLSQAGVTFSTPPTVIAQAGSVLTISQYVGTATATGVWTGLTSGQTATPTTLPVGCHYFVNGGTVPAQLSGQCGPPTDVASNGTGTNQFFRTWVSNLALHVNQAGYNAGTGSWAAGGANCPGVAACPHARFYIYEVWNEPESLQFFSGSFDQLIRMAYDADCLVVGTFLINPYTSETCPTVLASVGLTSPIDPTATIAMPSFTPFDFNHGHFESNTLYCNNSPATSCTVGTGHLYIQAINFHGKFANNAIYGNSSTVLEAVADSWTSTVNGFLQPAELLLPLWNTEGGFSGSSSFQDCSTATGTAPPYCNFSDSGMQQSYTSRDYIYSWCDGYTMMTWYNWPAGLPTAPAAAITATAGWMLNGSGMSCATSPPGTAKTGLFTYTASWTNSSGVPVAAIWDNSQDCAGACTTTTQTVSSIYKTYTDLAGDPPVTIIGNQVPVGIMPILLIGQQTTGVTPCARCLLY
jgi:hypothetical protein